MLIEFRNTYINASALAALVVYSDDGETRLRILLSGANGLTFNEVTMEELTDLVSALRAAINGGHSQK